MLLRRRPVGVRPDGEKLLKICVTTAGLQGLGDLAFLFHNESG